jgi:hypothetical protein
MENRLTEYINNKTNTPTEDNNFFIKNKTVLILWIFGFLGFVLYNMTQQISNAKNHNVW